MSGVAWAALRCEFGWDSRTSSPLPRLVREQRCATRWTTLERHRWIVSGGDRRSQKVDRSDHPPCQSTSMSLRDYPTHTSRTAIMGAFPLIFCLAPQIGRIYHKGPFHQSRRDPHRFHRKSWNTSWNTSPLETKRR